MAHPYRNGGNAKAKLSRMLGQKPGQDVGKFSDSPADEKEIGRFAKGYDIQMPGGAEKSPVRLDRRARGGKVHHKKGHTTVNVLVGGRGAPQPTPVPVPVPAGGGAPPMPPRPPMAGPPMPPPGMGGAGGPPMPPPGMGRKRGGVVGDKVASGTLTPNKMGADRVGTKGWNTPRAKSKGNRP